MRGKWGTICGRKRIRNIQDIGGLGCRVDEARSGSMRASAVQIVHFTPQITKNKL